MNLVYSTAFRLNRLFLTIFVTQCVLGSTAKPFIHLDGLCQIQYLVLAGDPVARTSPDFEFLTFHDYSDFVKPTLIEVVRRVTEHVLAVEFLAEVLDRFVQGRLAAERISFSSSEPRQRLEGIVCEYIFD